MAADQSQAICWFFLSDSAFALNGYDRAFAMLPADEQHRALEKSHPKVRHKYVWGRVLMRARLSAELNCTFSDLVFDYGPHGKPHLSSPSVTSDFSFSLTHTDNFIAFGAAPAKLYGIDAERIRPHRDLIKIAAAMFSEGESQNLLALSDERDRMRRFYELWTLREATVKSCGLSLFSQPKALSFEIREGAITVFLDEPFAARVGEAGLNFGTEWIEPDLVLSVAKSNDHRIGAGEHLSIHLKPAEDQLRHLLDR